MPLPTKFFLFALAALTAGSPAFAEDRVNQKLEEMARALWENPNYQPDEYRLSVNDMNNLLSQKKSERNRASIRVGGIYEPGIYHHSLPVLQSKMEEIPGRRLACLIAQIHEVRKIDWKRVTGDDNASKISFNINLNMVRRHVSLDRETLPVSVNLAEGKTQVVGLELNPTMSERGDCAASSAKQLEDEMNSAIDVRKEALARAEAQKRYDRKRDRTGREWIQTVRSAGEVSRSGN